MTIPPFLQNFIDGPKPPKIVLGVIGAVAIVAVAWLLLLSPEHTRLAALAQTNANLQLELVQNRAAVAQLTRFRRELAELQQKLATLQDKLPTERETPVVYRTVSDAAHESGLGVSLFQPRESKPMDYVNEIPIALTAEGGYHQLGEFFARVARLPRVVTVGEMRVTALPRSRSTVKADITLSTYTFRPAAPAPGGPGSAPPASKPSAALTSGQARS